MNLLIDLAHKNRKQSCDSYSTGSSVQSSSASPRRLRRNNNKVNSNENNTNSYSENSTSKSKLFLSFVLENFILNFFFVTSRLQLSKPNVYNEYAIFGLFRFGNVDNISVLVCRSTIEATPTTVQQRCT